MKGYSIRFTPVASLILVACSAPVSKPSADAGSARVPEQASNTTDRNNFRDDQSAAPRVNNVPIDP